MGSFHSSREHASMFMVVVCLVLVLIWVCLVLIWVLVCIPRLVLISLLWYRLLVGFVHLHIQHCQPCHPRRSAI